MKTKAHGWTYEKNPIAKLANGDWVRVWPQLNLGREEDSICLLPPATCDKVRKFLQNVESGVGYTRQQAAELLKLLPEVSE